MGNNNNDRQRRDTNKNRGGVTRTEGAFIDWVNKESHSDNFNGIRYEFD